MKSIALLALCFVIGQLKARCEEFKDARQVNLSGVIIPAKYFESHSALFSNRGSPIFWTPDSDSISKAEQKLADHLALIREKLKRSGKDTATLDHLIKQQTKQRRQYVGLIEGKRRLLHINLLPPASSVEPDDFNWREKYVVVYDGGADYWRIDFDIESSEFGSVDVNGGA